MQNQPPSLRYQIKVADLNAHLFEVSLECSGNIAKDQILSLPNWIPGSYLIRDFAKNIINIKAFSGSQPIEIKKINKHQWRLPPAANYKVIWQIYAYDLSVRSAHIDHQHAYFNGTSVFLAPIGQTELTCELDITPVQNKPNWRVATSLHSKSLYEFGRYVADNYDDLIDHPVEISDFSLYSFFVNDIQHDVVLTGRHYCDLPRLAADLEKICQTQLNFFGGSSPFKHNRYVFMTMVTANDYGGLEHRASTSLICARNDLPGKQLAAGEISDEYLNYLTLCSHEYFHNWNIKRIKPKAFAPYQLNKESYTTQLWAFEGFTSYYEALMIARSGLIDSQRFITYLAQTLTRVMRSSGRLKQSVAESSFDAWTKFYQQDANAVNAIVSYYTKGAYIALALDLSMRQHNSSLDELMVMLNDQFGAGQGIEEGKIEQLVNQLTQHDFSTFFQQALHSTEDINLQPLLAEVGVQFSLGKVHSLKQKGGKKSHFLVNEQPALGALLAPHPIGAQIRYVENHAAAYKAGLAPGDIIIALDSLKVTAENFEKELAKFALQSEVTIHAFRKDELLTLTLPLISCANHTVALDVFDQSQLDQWVLFQA